MAFKTGPLWALMSPLKTVTNPSLMFSHKSLAYLCLLFSPFSIHIHLFSSVRQHWEPGQLHNSQPFYLNRIFQKSCGCGSYKLCCPSALSSRKVSANEILVLIDTNIFQKGDCIIFKVQETISQRVTKFKKYRKYTIIDLKLWSCGHLF